MAECPPRHLDAAPRAPELFGFLAPLGENLTTKLEQFDDDALRAVADLLDFAAEATCRATSGGE